MAKGTVLVIEDEKDILELIAYHLKRDGYQVVGAASGEDGYKMARSSHPDIVVLDLMLPGMDGLEICKLLKGDGKTEHIPIIMLTAKSEDVDIITGLEVGADDYVTKPFSPRVLIARVRALLRRRAAHNVTRQDAIKIHDLTINPGRFEVLVADQSVSLTLTEFQILYTLAKHPGWVYSRDQLINEVRGEDSFITDRSIDVQIVGLRKKLGDAGQWIETVRGVGYRLKE